MRSLRHLQMTCLLFHSYFAQARILNDVSAESWQSELRISKVRTHKVKNRVSLTARMYCQNTSVMTSPEVRPRLLVRKRRRTQFSVSQGASH